MRHQSVTYVLLTLAVAGFVWISLDLDFYQDDAYISYRYAANYLDGHGLVFNQGERVEGYTNFGWVLLMLLGGVLGLGYVTLSKAVGIILGAGVVVLALLVAESCLGAQRRWWPLLASTLVAFNLSLAYWAQSGLETAAFTLTATLSLYLFLRRSRMLPAALVLAVLVRPEGALLALLFILIEVLVERRWPLYSLAGAGLALLFSLPYVGFKLGYYGAILPNSFYAKTGFDIEQISSGLDYAGRFFSHYPHFAAAPVVAVLLWRRLSRESRAVWLFTLGYVVYIVAIGGDVLKVHRFFLPVLASMAVVTAVLVSELVRRSRYWLQMGALVVVALALTAAGLFLPRGFILRYAGLEKGLTDKMGFIAANLRDVDPTGFTVASATIGRLGYDLRGHRVIDLLGLTDTTIARHPEPTPDGMESTWRERAFNSLYILEQAPDYIIFATGLKPSAPAERALFRYEKFLACYRTAAFYYEPGGVKLEAPLVSVFRKKCEPRPPFEPQYPIAFVNSYNRGTNAFNSGRFHEADRYFSTARQLGPDPPYVYLLYRMAMNSFRLGQIERGETLQNEIVRIDSTVAEVQGDLYVYEYTIGNREKAAIHRRWLDSLWPWMVPRYDSVAEARARHWQANPPGRP